jgi:hypothetical protein
LITKQRLWASGLIAAVLIMNLQCAAAFLIQPWAFAPNFELQGEVGAAVIRSLGVLFVMWNIPYGVALWDPVRHRLALYEALGMQATGLAGEALIYALLPVVHFVARGAILRFIVFDALGLLVLAAAAWLSRNQPPVADFL